MDAVMGMQMAQFQTNYTFGLMKMAMDDIASSISSISGAIDGAVADVTGVAGSTRVLVDDMAGIASGMGTNQEIVGELQKQMDVFSNL